METSSRWPSFGTILAFIILLIFLLAAMFPQVTARFGQWFIDRLVPGRFRQQTSGIMHKFLDGLASLRSPANVLMVFLTSVVIWLLETGKYWFVMHAFNFQVSFFALMLMNGIVNLIGIIPAAPGYIGTFDASGIAVLVAYGVDRPLPPDIPSYCTWRSGCPSRCWGPITWHAKASSGATR